MTLDELMRVVCTVAPNATVEFDNYGQIIIYTDLTQMEPDAELVEFDSDGG